MSFDWERTLLLWDPDDPKLFDLDVAAFRSKEIQTYEVQYDRIGADPDLAHVIKSIEPQAILFTRNDDMPGRPLIGKLLSAVRVGYTCLSAIDPGFQVVQTKTCIQDVLSGQGFPEMPDSDHVDTPTPGGNGTFTFIFDFEQLGCARFGMPRLLPLLEKRGIRATFFVTGFIREIYPNLLKRLAKAGHELGIHGNMHEFYSGRDLSDQSHRLKVEKASLEPFGGVTGANLIFRMDDVTPDAMAAAGLNYFVLFRKHVFYKTRFMSPSTKPSLFRTDFGDLTMIPVTAETYGLPWEEIVGAVNSGIKYSQKQGNNHISILMHPFKDGALSRVGQVSRLIDYLMDDMKLRPVRLCDIPKQQCDSQAVAIRYRWDGNEPHSPAADKCTDPWWNSVFYHSQRTEAVYEQLRETGVDSVLRSSIDNSPSVTVFPDSAENTGNTVLADPLVTGVAQEIVQSGTQSTFIGPPGHIRDFINFLIFHIPRTFADCSVLFRRILTKFRIRS